MVRGAHLNPINLSSSPLDSIVTSVEQSKRKGVELKPTDASDTASSTSIASSSVPSSILIPPPYVTCPHPMSTLVSSTSSSQLQTTSRDRDDGLSMQGVYDKLKQITTLPPLVSTTTTPGVDTPKTATATTEHSTATMSPMTTTNGNSTQSSLTSSSTSATSSSSPSDSFVPALPTIPQSIRQWNDIWVECNDQTTRLHLCYYLYYNIINTTSSTSSGSHSTKLLVGPLGYDTLSHVVQTLHHHIIINNDTGGSSSSSSSTSSPPPLIEVAFALLSALSLMSRCQMAVAFLDSGDKDAINLLINKLYQLSPHISTTTTTSSSSSTLSQASTTETKESEGNAGGSSNNTKASSTKSKTKTTTNRGGNKNAYPMMISGWSEELMGLMSTSGSTSGIESKNEDQSDNNSLERLIGRDEDLSRTETPLLDNGGSIIGGWGNWDEWSGTTAKKTKKAVTKITTSHAGSGKTSGTTGTNPGTKSSVGGGQGAASVTVFSKVNVMKLASKLSIDIQ